MYRIHVDHVMNGIPFRRLCLLAPLPSKIIISLGVLEPEALCQVNTASIPFLECLRASAPAVSLIPEFYYC
jgi:hypothetical protein